MDPSLARNRGTGGQMNDSNLAGEARANAERTRAAVEETYWLPDRGFYAFATALPRATRAEAEPGPNLSARRARMDALSTSHLIDEDTALPAVPLWWHELQDERAQSEIDHLGSADIATDWGDRIISEKSALYDPLSYHYGSVWPLFTGWTGVAAYAYGRPHVGYQALMANASLTFANALGYVTELLSGEFNAPFGRSSHHQVWSEAMVVSATMRGLLGLEVSDGGKTMRFAPQLPADWDHVSVTNVAAGGGRYDLTLTQERPGGPAREIISLSRRDAEKPPSAGGRGLERAIIAPAFPLDATIKSVYVNGRATKFDVVTVGDITRVQVILDGPSPNVEVVFGYFVGTDVYDTPAALKAGQRSEGLRIIRSHADQNALHLTLEGLGGRQYSLSVKSRGGRILHSVSGAKVSELPGHDPQVSINFDGPSGVYVRRQIDIPSESQ